MGLGNVDRGGNGGAVRVPTGSFALKLGTQSGAFVENLIRTQSGQPLLHEDPEYARVLSGERGPRPADTATARTESADAATGLIGVAEGADGTGSQARAVLSQ